MAPLVVLALALLAGSTHAKDRIVGGSPTTIAQYPSIVQVDSLGIFSGIWGQSCAAIILTGNFMLSAAHCFDGATYSPDRRRVRAGTTYRNTGGLIAYVEREFNHPSYNTPDLGFDGDIAVVKLRTSLEYSPVIQQGIIVNQGTQLPDNTPVIHAGWGATSQGGPASPQLLDVTIYTVNHNICSERYDAIVRPPGSPPRPITENMICAGLLDVGGADACQGDSGGPLYYTDATHGNVVVGVVSWGQGCANARYPGISTKVSSYTYWIEDTVMRHSLYFPEMRRVRTGTTYRNTGGLIAYVEREFNHPSYNTANLGFDGNISVIKLWSSLVYSPVIQQGIIVNQGAQLSDNTPVIHAGWGATAEGGSASPQLLDVTIYTVNRELCAARYDTIVRPEGSLPRPVTENMICAGLLDVGGADACQGDSGGPLYYNDPELEHVILGLVSWGHGCANAVLPGISTSVSSYTNWINDTVVANT